MFACQWHLDVPFEVALGGMGGPRFNRHSDPLAPFIVPGSQHRVDRVVDGRAG